MLFRSADSVTGQESDPRNEKQTTVTAVTGQNGIGGNGHDEQQEAIDAVWGAIKADHAKRKAAQ